MKNKIRLINKVLLFVFFSLSTFILSGQIDGIKILRKNIISINLISLPPLITNQNQKWIGIEYSRVVNQRVSFSVTTDIGVFENYTYTKYYDFFDEDQGFSYISENVRIPGYHIIPSMEYVVFQLKKKADLGIYVAAKFDYYHYFLNKDIYYSSTDKSQTIYNTTYRFNIGAGVGMHYIAFKRLVLDLNISLFTKIYSKSSSDKSPELYPENSFWRSSNNSNWATINLMLGYAFGN